ncbi:patatin-like phospholipase family protein [Pseudonocardia alni]|uniref:patatin-like phospholipase family protein n=1 Tax=Pseudonocardia alni TaxID=33907 RepID=UPI0033E9EE5D
MTGARIGLAVSGGGFRATAFGLGCLRALHDLDLLDQVVVVSGISGGSLLSAMWAYGPHEFAEFDASVVELLRSGLQLELARRALTPPALARIGASAVAATVQRSRPRHHTPTDALAAALAAREFGQRRLHEVTHPGVESVISATDFGSGNAVRYGSRAATCSPYGRIVDEITVADAVAASASYPLAFPALHRRYEFERTDGTRHVQNVALTDGGVYDNLGLAPLLPGRSAQHTAHVYPLDYLVCADAGRGRAPRRPARFLPRRLLHSFDITYAKTQDGGRSQLHQAQLTGRLTGVVHAYLGMEDRKMPVPIADLVPRHRVDQYATNLRRMDDADIAAITTRGEQLTRVLLDWYCPELHPLSRRRCVKVGQEPRCEHESSRQQERRPLVQPGRLDRSEPDARRGSGEVKS